MLPSLWFAFVARDDDIFFDNVTLRWSALVIGVGICALWFAVTWTVLRIRQGRAIAKGIAVGS